TGNVLAISDSGGGGRFASLIAGHPDSAPLLALATLTTAPGSASVLASESARIANNAIGVGIVVDASLSGVAVYEGSITVALAGPVQVVDVIPMRSGFEDVQRRSALFAADVLRKALLSRS
ncbi:MAG: hypothetical protein IT336_14535, partial [Thermomicrobiales bacterium]|nr:hypothetical protein [Thermomicrobiales bacterium]